MKSEVHLMLSELNKNIATVLDEVRQLSEKFDGIANSLVSLASSAVTNKEQLQEVGKLLQDIQNSAKATRDTIISAVTDSASSSAVAQQQALTAAVETMHLRVKNIFEESSTEVSSIV
jgi:phage-related tail protein